MASLTVRAQPHEKKAWMLTADKYGKDLSTVVRDVLNALAAGKIKYPSPVKQDEIRHIQEENR